MVVIFQDDGHSCNIESFTLYGYFILIIILSPEHIHPYCNGEQVCFGI